MSSNSAPPTSSQDSQELPPLVIVEEPAASPMPVPQQPAAQQQALGQDPAADASLQQAVGQEPAVDDSVDVKPFTGDLEATATATSPSFPRFPKNLPHVHINTLEFEQGFDESCLVGAAPSMAICVICRGFPRRPVTLDVCGHLFCEPCINTWFETSGARHNRWGHIMIAPCPTCRTSFQAGEIITWELWQKWAQLTYNAQVVMCPFECGFRGTASEVDHHQVRECAKRKIDCPVDGCRVRGPADYIEKVHFRRCPFLKIYCTKCRLPVRASLFATHDCIGRLQEALTGTLAEILTFS